MKRGCASNYSSSSNSNSCIGVTITNQAMNAELKKKKKKSDAETTNKPKRVRAKKLDTSDHNSADASPKSRSSAYRGVTRHRWTGRYEAHLWDKTTWNNIQTKRGRQIYLGAYDDELDAARTYDLAALKYWGPSTTINLPAECYAKEIEEMEKVPRDEYIASLRRRSNGFSRGVSKYRGVARHHHNGRWEARIGRVSGNKYLYLGTYSTQEEAAEAYDKAAIKYRGANAITNFNINNYMDGLGNLVSGLEVEQEVAREKEELNPEPLISVQVDGAVDDSQPMTIMDPTENHEYPWGLCLDTGFNPLPLPDTPLDKASELLDWLDHKVFKDDDIAYIFDFENDFTLEDAMSGTSGYKGEANVKVAEDLKENDLSTSHSSSSLSTMASVSSNI